MAFLYEKSADTSAWTYAHEFGRGHVDEVLACLLYTSRTIQQQGGVNLSVILDGLSGILPQKFIDDITASAAGMLDSGAPDIAQQVVEKIIAPLVVPLITDVYKRQQLYYGPFAQCDGVYAPGAGMS